MVTSSQPPALTGGIFICLTQIFQVLALFEYTQFWSRKMRIMLRLTGLN